MTSTLIAKNIFLIVGPDNRHDNQLSSDKRVAKRQWRKAGITLTIHGDGGNSGLNIKDIAAYAAGQSYGTLVVIDAHGHKTSGFHEVMLNRNDMVPTTRLLDAINRKSITPVFQYLLLSCYAGEIHNDLNRSPGILPKGTRIATLNAGNEALEGRDVIRLIKKLPEAFANRQDPLQGTLSLWHRYNSQRTTPTITTV